MRSQLYNSYFIGAFLFICNLVPCLSIQAQSESRLLHPSYTDKYLSHTLLPDGGIRIFWISDDYEGSEIYIVKYTDIHPGTSLDSIVSVHVDVPESYNWNYGSFEYVSLHMADGSTLLMNNTPGCDVAAIGAVVKLGSGGSIEWFTDFDKDAFYVMATKMVFIDHQRIGIEGHSIYGPDMIIDLQGNLLSLEEVSFPYEETIETNEGYVAGVGNRLDILDTSFQVVLSHTLHQPILNVNVHPDEKYIVQTSDSFYLLDSVGLLTVLPFPQGDYDVVWPVGKDYWAASGNQQMVIHFDSSFTPLEIYPLSPGIKPIIGIALENAIVLGGSYSNGVNEGMLVFKADTAEVDFKLDQDISIASISIPDSVVVEYINEPFFGSGWIYHYDFVDVEVANHGPDTIQNFIIQDHATTHCYFCHRAFNRWYIDSVSIAPGTSLTLSLGSYVPVCLYNEPGSLCLSVLSPNEEADGNYLNDSHCELFAILIGAKDVPPPSGLSLSPNPASDFVNIDISSLPPGANKISIFNMAGQKMEDFHMIPEDNLITIEGYTPGMYLLHLVDSEGGYYIQRFVIQ